MKRNSTFKPKPTVSLKRAKLKRKSKSASALLKDEIQLYLRLIVIARDGGCFLRLYSDSIAMKYQHCGGFRNDGELILQAEHLHARNNAVSFSDSRLVVCCCYRHHFYYKKEYPDEYYKFAKDFIGKERTALLLRVQEDRRAYKVDLKLELIGLKQEYAKLQA